MHTRRFADLYEGATAELNKPKGSQKGQEKQGFHNQQADVPESVAVAVRRRFTLCDHGPRRRPGSPETSPISHLCAA
jgi:hypothetical protein